MTAMCHVSVFEWKNNNILICCSQPNKSHDFIQNSKCCAQFNWNIFDPLRVDRLFNFFPLVILFAFSFTQPPHLLTSFEL